ncbi:MAG: DMT family transporter [Planctomycetaceae bacterium]|jgi:drug/metabolite transporter (DMT)-like permease|nr:DMT family transporter [Planctomycetaceae bacterium]
MKTWQADFSIFIAAVLWGLSYIFANEGMVFASPALFLLIRFAVALLITFLFFGFMSMRTLKAKTWRRGLFLGSLFGGAYLLQMYAINFTTIPKASFITALVLPAVPFVSFFLLKKPITIWNMIGVALAMLGIYFLVDPDFREFTNIQAGDIIAFCSIPLWALYLNYIDVYTTEMEEDADTSKMLMLQFLGAIPVLLIVTVVFESGLILAPLHESMGKGFVWNVPDLWKFFVCIGYLSLLGSFALTFIQTAAQKYTTPVKAMIIFQFEPIIATVTSVLFYYYYLGNAEYEPGTKMFLGCVIILTAVLISELGPRRKTE